MFDKFDKDKASEKVPMDIFMESMLAIMKDEFVAKITVINGNIINVQFPKDQYNVVVEKI